MLNNALKQMRKFHQIKQVDMAKKLEISNSYLSEIESNNKSISMCLLQKYAGIFDIPPSSLLMFSENLDAAKNSEKLRLKCSHKIVKLLEWINARD